MRDTSRPPKRGDPQIDGDDRREARAEEYEATIAEIELRTRNMLARLRSIVRLTPDGHQDLPEYLMHFQGRLDAIGRSYATAIGFAADGVRLDRLVSDELEVYLAREGDDFSMSGPAVSLTFRAAEALRLGFHELATNAMKYGALSKRKGTIEVSWNVKGKTVRCLHFAWNERFRTLRRKAPQRRGFGLVVLEQTLPYELGAKTDHKVSAEGMCFTMTVPLNAENCVSRASNRRQSSRSPSL